MSGENPIRVTVHGAAGKVGREVLLAINKAEGVTLVAAIDRIPATELQPLPVEVPYFTNTETAIKESPADVVVDFTNPAASMEMAPVALQAGLRLVIGSTGFNPEQLNRLEALCTTHQRSAIVAPNFTIGAILLGHLAAIAAPFFEYVDILEEHHEMKIDAPSGTSLSIAKAIEEAGKSKFKMNVPEREPLKGTRGGNHNGITIHSIRMPGRVAHHQVTFGGPGQTLIIRHDTSNRECYMPGVIMAVRRVGQMNGLIHGLEQILDI
jgi:4-hydroxy-tetrahydrodipicolinate reductase